ncbi:MAG: hypothetical protein FGM52_09505, partial [Mycobacterium sp.]|nr:hypothetical protein [Mycobacterium sp.]
VYAGRPRVRCTFDSFTEDTSLNRTLKAAARAVSASLLLPLGLRFRGRRIAEWLNTAGELRREDIHVLPDRNRPHYRDAHQFAALILKSTGIEVSHGGRIAQTFLLRTPDAVEEGIRCALNEHLPKEHAVKRGGKELIAGDSSGAKKRRVTPDIIFGRDLAVGDVKYVITNGDVSTAHLYQVTTFATAYEAEKAALIGFGPGSVDARIEVGNVSVRGFSWKTTEADPRTAAAKLGFEVASWLWTN